MIFRNIKRVAFFVKLNFIIIIGILHLTGEPILLHLLRCKGFAVKYHSCILYALHLQQA